MPRKIIFAEDDEDLRASYQRYFQRKIENSEIYTVSSGEDLVEKVRTGSYDLAVSDYNMGGITGVEATSRIRKFNTQIPIIILSGRMSQIEKQARDAGANECISKGEDLPVIIKRITSYLPKGVSA